MNNQPPEKPQGSDGSLDVVKIFPTIQGEGPFVGRPCVFVRLAGCNLACPLCDTDYTSGRTRKSPETIIRESIKLMPGDASLLVITGGEPFRQNIDALVKRALSDGLTVQIETNGTLALCDSFPSMLQRNLYIVVSPKTGRVHPRIAERACAYKYVARMEDLNPLDGLPNYALLHPAEPKLARPPARIRLEEIYLQPADEFDAAKNAVNQEACLNSCLKHGYTFGLQLHKIVGVE